MNNFETSSKNVVKAGWKKCQKYESLVIVKCKLIILILRLFH